MNEETLFNLALQLPASERAVFLDRECSDPALRARVEALLAADVQSRSPLDAPIEQASTLCDPDATGAFQSVPATEEAEGMVIAGRYKLQQQIGEGGMGTVWMADQIEPVKRKVAVKLIRVDRGQTRTILARFDAERQAIALMDHPHIARLLDAGTTHTGAPFFVMELVKGIPLNEFCDLHKLTIPERLNLFTQICSAVQHAHQKGIIHRDLKPGNILVENHDGKPVPKVIDFGLAKATTGLQLTEQSVFTAFGSLMGTPLYMAPEQATFNAVDVDTRADVYALGVILYELLTGTTPITRDTLKKAALDEMLRLIREQEAPTPSSRLNSLDNAPSVAACRQIEPQKLGRSMKGELEWIVMKALSKERDRRYDSATNFARDVERFLNHEPVAAGPPSASYRFKKFVQRNKGPMIAASLVLLALVAGVVGTTLAMLRAWTAESHTADALQRVTQEQGRTQEALQRVTQEQGRTQEALLAEQNAKKSETRAREEADKARLQADENADLAQKRFYATQITLASHALAAGQPARVLDMLATLEPAKGTKDYRTWEWYHLLHQVNADLRAHVPANTIFMTYTPDGKLLFAHDGANVRFLDPVTGRDRFPRQSGGVPNANQVSCMAASPDSSLLASGTFTGLVRFWDAHTGTLKVEFPYGRMIRTIAWKPDNSQVAITIDEPGDNNRIQFRHGKSLEVLKELTLPLLMTARNHLAFSPNGKYMSCICLDGVRLYELGGEVPQLVHNFGKLHGLNGGGSVVWSRDGTLLAATLSDNITIWDVATKKEHRQISTTGAHLDFSPDGKRLVLGNVGRREITCWDVDSGQLLARRGHLSPVMTVRADPNGRGWASADILKGIKLWNYPATAGESNLAQLFQESAMRGNEIAPDRGEWSPFLEAGLTAAVPDRESIPGKVYAAFPEQKAWVTRERTRGQTERLHLVSTVTGKVIQTEEFFTGGQGEAFATSQAREPIFLTASQDWSRRRVPIYVWEIREGRLSKRCEFLPNDTVVGATLSPDGETVLTAQQFGAVQIYSAQTGKPLGRLNPSEGAYSFGQATRVTFSSDGKLVAVGFSDNRCFVYDWPSRRLRITLNGHVGGISSLALFPDGRTLASSSSDATILWDIDTGQQRLSLPAMKQLHISPDGSTLYGIENGRGVVYRSVKSPVAVTRLPSPVPFVRRIDPWRFPMTDRVAGDNGRIASKALDS